MTKKDKNKQNVFTMIIHLSSHFGYLGYSSIKIIKDHDLFDRYSVWLKILAPRSNITQKYTVHESILHSPL